MSETRARVAIVVGTRPEAIKQAPVVLAAHASGLFDPVVVATGQHDRPVVDALEAFGVAIHHALDASAVIDGTQAERFGWMLPGLDRVLADAGVAAVVVQGDTASALAGALAGTWQQIPVVHLEAGLRSFDRANPFPEESYRKAIAALADLHLAPTPMALANLRAEGIHGPRAVCIGNTVVDAGELSHASAVAGGSSAAAPGGLRRVLVTIHRRENWGAPLTGVLAALERIVAAVPDIEVVIPVHPNPTVRAVIRTRLGGVDRVRIVEALGHAAFIEQLAGSTLVLTDSGGVQEEAPAFGVPVLVLRETTERPEAVAAGSAELVGTDPDHVVEVACRLLLDEDRRQLMARVSNPFGDGRSGERAVAAVAALLGLGEPPEPWAPAEGNARPLAPV